MLFIWHRTFNGNSVYVGFANIVFFFSIVSILYLCERSKLSLMLMVWTGNNVNDLVPLLPPNVIIVFCIIFLSLLSWCRSLKWLSPFSLLAECCTVGKLTFLQVAEFCVEVGPGAYLTFCMQLALLLLTGMLWG